MTQLIQSDDPELDGLRISVLFEESDDVDGDAEFLQIVGAIAFASFIVGYVCWVIWGKR